MPGPREIPFAVAWKSGFQGSFLLPGTAPFGPYCGSVAPVSANRERRNVKISLARLQTRGSSRVNRRKTVSTRCMDRGNRERNTRADRFSLCPFFVLFSRLKPSSFCFTRDETFEEDKIRSAGKSKVEEN